MISPRPVNSYNSFAFFFSFGLQTLKPILLIVLFHSPGTHSQFLDQFSDFFFKLVLKRENVITVGDFDIHVEAVGDRLHAVFNAILDSIGFIQNIHQPTNFSLHMLNLMPTYGRTDCSA